MLFSLFPSSRIFQLGKIIWQVTKQLETSLLNMCCLKLTIFVVILQTTISLEYYEKNLLDEIIAGNAMKPAKDYDKNQSQKLEAHPDNERLGKVSRLPLKYFFPNSRDKEAPHTNNFLNNLLNTNKQVKKIEINNIKSRFYRIYFFIFF